MCQSNKWGSQIFSCLDNPPHNLTPSPFIKESIKLSITYWMEPQRSHLWHSYPPGHISVFPLKQTVSGVFPPIDQTFLNPMKAIDNMSGLNKIGDPAINILCILVHFILLLHILLSIQHMFCHINILSAFDCFNFFMPCSS